MPKLVQKCGYIRNGSTAKYMRYIATREGVEKLHGRGPVTQPQKELIERLLKDYPDTKELFEYSDYCASPTFGNASELITMALDANVHTMEAGDGYLKYIATRPRVEKRGDHGLFSDTQDVSLQDMMAEVAEHHGPVWTVILSLRREDASVLGYDSAENWRTLLLQHRTRLAQAMKIPVDDFRWCAAFHDEGYHPHVHMMVWSADEKHGYLNKTGITAMRSALTNTIFQDEMHNLYVKKDLAYQDLVKQSRSAMAELIARMESTSLDNDSIARKMVELANALGSVKGKKQYGYLPKKLKELVDAITDELHCNQMWQRAIRSGMICVINWRGTTRTNHVSIILSQSKRNSRQSRTPLSARLIVYVWNWNRKRWTPPIQMRTKNQEKLIRPRHHQKRIAPNSLLSHRQ